MKSLHRLLVIPAALLAFGCKGSDSKNVDAALASDLATASQARPYTPADSVSAAERARANSFANTPAVAAPAPAPQRTVVHHVYTSRPSRSRASSGGGTYSAPQRTGPIDHVEKNTKRDAAIGAGAGAILGAVTSRDKVKGGIIGGVLGGVLGGVVGNNVDKKKVPNP